MRTEDINRKFKLHDERRAAAQLPDQLQGLDVVGFVRTDEFPVKLLSAFGEFASAAVPPHTRIYRNAQPNRIDAWLLDLLRQARIGDRFFLRTGLEYFPWADCRVLDHRWLESLRRVIGPSQGFIAADKDSVVMTIGAQYEMLGFASPTPPATMPDSVRTEDTALGLTEVIASTRPEASTSAHTIDQVPLADSARPNEPAPHSEPAMMDDHAQQSDAATTVIRRSAPERPDDAEATVLMTRVQAPTPPVGPEHGPDGSPARNEQL
ncbi:hypothetical protein [Nocardia sp. NBC_01388]|uniref:hypothetical protein n=1 Tax=Nocardia sp. NBC_01388 TaxID=2903596 RepID=UPI0032502F55